MQEIKVKWVAEIESWKETVAAVGAFHHLAHLRTLGLLQAAQSDALLVKQDRRKENLGRIERDFRLMQFQTRVEDLNDVVTQSDVDLDEMEAALHAKSAAYDASIVELQKLQSKYSELKRDDVEKTAELKSVQSVLEKTSLQLTSANTIKKSLQTTIDALKSESAEYKQELNKREALESKGGEEVDNLRRQKMDLEVRLKEAISRSGKQYGNSRQEFRLTSLTEKDASKLEKNKEALNKLTRAHKDVEEQLQEEKDRREMAEHKARKIESKMKILNMLKEVEEEEEGTEEEADIVEVPSYPPPNTKRDIRGKAEKDNGKRKAQDEGANDVQEVPSKPRIKANTIAADEKAAKKVKTVKASKTLAISSVPEAKLQQPAKKKRRIQIGAMAGPSSQILSSLARLPEDVSDEDNLPVIPTDYLHF